MRKCRFCQQPVDNAATVCPHCGRDLIPGRSTLTKADAGAAATAAAEMAPIGRVSVVDVDMPFPSMVWFMVKWAAASIPAVIIIGCTVGIILMALGLLFGGLGMLVR